MAQRVNRSGRGPGRPAAKKKPAKRKATVKGAFVKLGIMGNGTYEACIKLGETSIKQLFEQVNKHESTDFKPGETIYMNGDCEGAIRNFESYIGSFGSGAYLLNAHFYKAECQMKMQADGKKR